MKKQDRVRPTTMKEVDMKQRQRISVSSALRSLTPWSSRSLVIPVVVGWFLLAIFSAAPPAWAVQPLTSSSGQPCKTFTGEPAQGLFEFDPSPIALEAVKKITDLLGLEDHRFTVKASNVGNAAALLCGEERMLLYSSAFFADVVDSSGLGFEKYALLAHEIAHHLNGHTVLTGEKRELLELEADEHAGFVVCQLGGTTKDATRIFEIASGEQWGGSSTAPGYPPLSARVAAVMAGWDKAMKGNKCPESARNSPLPAKRLFPNLDGALVINPETAARLAERPTITAARIHFENVDFVVDHPLILAAEEITFDQNSKLRGPKLSLISQVIEGGAIDASGSLGQVGGEVLVATLRMSGTSILARGGDGSSGSNGAPGKDGRPGEDGVGGRCGPGMLNEFRGSTGGQAGAPGGDGEPGGNGGDGGSGGRVVLLTFQQQAVLVDAEGGLGGPGGFGGSAGRGGHGGRGGSGCSGLGGSQPTRADGPDGRDGRPGSNGSPGLRGAPGQVWRQPLGSLNELRDFVQRPDGDLARAVQELEKLLTKN